MCVFCPCMHIRGKGLIDNRYVVLCIYLYIFTYLIVLLSWNMVCTDWYTFGYKHVARLFQPCRNLLHCYNLVTTLLQPWNRLEGVTNPWFRPPPGKVVTTLYQPCHNLVPTLLLPCSQVGTRLIQAGNNVVNIIMVKGRLYYLVTRLSQPSPLYIDACI